MVIDWEHHFFPEDIVRRWGGKAGQVLIKNGKVGGHMFDELFDIDAHLKFMDAAGIDVAVFSGTYYAVKDCIITDDFYAKITADYPDRFVCLAPCVPTKGEEALDELERAIDLGLRGVVISPQIEGAALDSRRLWPFYEKVSELKVPVFVHVSLIARGFDALDAPYNLNETMTREFEIAATTARLILGGVLVDFPDLKFVMPHMGGGIAAILERIELWLDDYGEKFWTEVGGTPPFSRPFKENFRKYFGKIYFDLAGYEQGVNTLRCALTTINPDRLVFATDYPFNFTDDPAGVKSYIEMIRSLDLPEAQIEGVLGGNAAELLGIKDQTSL